MRRAVKIDFANLVNLLVNRPVVPELLQNDCTPERLEAAVVTLLTDPAARQAQFDAFEQALGQIGLGGELPRSQGGGESAGTGRRA